MRRLQLDVVCFLDATPRAERKLGQVCSEKEYANVFDRLNNTLPPSVEHLIIQLGKFLPTIRRRRAGLNKRRNSDFVPPLGSLGDRAIIEILSCYRT